MTRTLVQSAMNRRRALITGVGGQDGFFLAKFLSGKGYEIFGITDVPLVGKFNDDSLVYEKIKTFVGDFTNETFLQKVLAEGMPHEIYHFAAQSNVGLSYTKPLMTYTVNAIGTFNLLRVCADICPEAKIYLSGSSEMFGEAVSSPQSEATSFNPISPYGQSKVAAYYSSLGFRKERNLFVVTGITYNHESERRPVEFVTQKICAGLASYVSGSAAPLILGNLNATRDWGFAGDYVEAMWLMLQQEFPEDFVIATGVGRTVEDFVNAAAQSLSVQLEWHGEGVNRYAIDSKNGQRVVTVSADYFRPAEKIPLVGDASQIGKVLGWKPRTDFSALVQRMTSSAVAGKADGV